jgi:hypothetical protein
MTPKITNSQLATAVTELKRRLQSDYSNPIARLLFLAGTRDISTGLYSDERLAHRFDPATAAESLRLMHREIFEELAFSSLQEILVHVSEFIFNDTGNPVGTLTEWLETKPYRILRPKDYDPIAASVLFSQIRTALEIVAVRRQHPPAQ